MKRIFTLLICSLVLVACGGSGEKVYLRYSLEPGQQYQMTMSADADITVEMMGQKMKMETEIESDFTYNIKSHHDSVYSVDFVYDKMELSMSAMGQEMSFSSEDTDDPMKFGAMMNTITGKTLTMDMTDKGKVLDIRGFDELYASMAEYLGSEMGAEAAQVQKALESSFGPETIKHNFEMSSAIYPDLPVAKGDKWEITISTKAMMAMTVKGTYEYKGVKDGYNVISCKAEILPGENNDFVENNGMMMRYIVKGDMIGEFKLNKDTGWPHEMDMTMNLKGKAEVQANSMMPEDIEMPVDMIMKIKFEERD